MPLSPFATSADVAARWRPLTPAESTVSDTLVGDASALIRARFPGIDSEVASGAMDPMILTIVVAGMVKRALIAPLEGVSQESETAGPFGHTQTFVNPMRNVFLSEADMTLILGYRPAGMSAGFANDTSFVPTYQTVYGW